MRYGLTMTLLGMLPLTAVAESSWETRGSIGFEKFMATDDEVSEEDRLIKDEVRLTLELVYAGDGYSLFMRPQLYGLLTPGEDRYRYRDELKSYSNLTVSSEHYELSFPELYYSRETDAYRLRIGNQIYNWGTADIINPTAWFNPIDYREILFREPDEAREGVPSVSLLTYPGEWTFEMVLTVLPVTSKDPLYGDFWYPDFDNLPMEVYLAEGEDDPGNPGFGARLSTTLGSTDFSFSAYRGPDKDLLLVPEETLITDTGEVGVRVRADTVPVTMVGMDVAHSIDRFVFQAEAAWSPDKQRVINQSRLAPQDMAFPWEMDKGGWISWSTGFNYFIPMEKLIEDHQGDAVLTVEYLESRYEDGGTAGGGLTADFIGARIQDSYMENRLEVALTAMQEKNGAGNLIWPWVGYRFDNGFRAGASWVRVEAGDPGQNRLASLFYYIRKKDLLSLKLNYEF